MSPRYSSSRLAAAYGSDLLRPLPRLLGAARCPTYIPSPTKGAIGRQPTCERGRRFCSCSAKQPGATRRPATSPASRSSWGPPKSAASFLALNRRTHSPAAHAMYSWRAVQRAPAASWWAPRKPAIWPAVAAAGLPVPHLVAAAADHHRQAGWPGSAGICPDRERTLGTCRRSCLLRQSSQLSCGAPDFRASSLTSCLPDFRASSAHTRNPTWFFVEAAPQFLLPIRMRSEVYGKQVFSVKQRRPQNLPAGQPDGDSRHLRIRNS